MSYVMTIKQISREEPNRFYKCLPSDEYAQLKAYASGLMPVFGSIYLCENTFLEIKCVKSYYR